MQTKTTRWRGNVFRILLLAATTSILGCIEEESEYTINPDLSGKVALELIFVPWYLEQAEPGEAPEELLKPQIESILRRSRSICAAFAARVPRGPRAARYSPVPTLWASSWSMR